MKEKEKETVTYTFKKDNVINALEDFCEGWDESVKWQIHSLIEAFLINMHEINVEVEPKNNLEKKEKRTYEIEFNGYVELFENFCERFEVTPEKQLELIIKNFVERWPDNLGLLVSNYVDIDSYFECSVAD